MGASIIINISLDGAPNLNPCWRVDCTRCGPVEKGAGNMIVGRANDHNRISHSDRGFVNVPAELSGKRYF